MVSDPALDDLLSDEAVNTPSVYFDKLRNISPVYWNTRWGGWIVTGYEEVTQGYRDWQRLSSDRFTGPFGGELRADLDEQSQLYSFLTKFFVWKDPPYHTRMRSLIGAAFTPKRMEALRPRIRELVRELAEPLRGKESVDFFGEFSFHLPVIVIAEFLGIPTESRYDVREWSEALGAVIFVQGDDGERMHRGETAMTKIAEFLRPILRERQKQPKDDFISTMLAAEVDGTRLTEDEIVAAAILMVFAGHETTMNLISNGIVAFDKFPDQWIKMRGNRELSRAATEETLRYDGPIRGMGRWATEPMELGGQPIAEKDRVFLMQYAANHDPAAFVEPHSFDIERSPIRHAGFGQGIHTCLGAPLARMETQETYAYFAETFPRIEVLTEKLRYNRVMITRSLRELRVRFDEA